MGFNPCDTPGLHALSKHNSSLDAETSLDDRESADRDFLRVKKTGALLVVGLGAHDAPDDYCIEQTRDRLFELIDRYQCRELAFDLAGVSRVPSGMLGVMHNIADRGVDVTVYNPSCEVEEVFEITKFDKFILIVEVE